jgi:hypothetical protein
MVALGEVTDPAVRAGAAAEDGGEQHPVAGLEVADAVADLLDHAHAFVPQHLSRFHPRHRAADEVQVGAADRRGGDTHDGVGRLLDLRFRYVVQADVADVVVHNCLHCPAVSPPP